MGYICSKLKKDLFDRVCPKILGSHGMSSPIS